MAQAPSWLQKAKNFTSSLLGTSSPPIAPTAPQTTAVQTPSYRSLDERFKSAARKLKMDRNFAEILDKFLEDMARIEEIQERIEEKE